jgi:hypothetical protein
MVVESHEGHIEDIVTVPWLNESGVAFQTITYHSSFSFLHFASPCMESS